MPWYKTLDTLPPMGKELTIFNGKQETKTLNALDVMDGKGGVRKDVFQFWTYEKNLPDPKEDSLKGIGHVTAEVQQEKCEPKLVDGRPAPKGPDFIAEGAWDLR